MITNISLTNRSGLDQVNKGDRVTFRVISMDLIGMVTGTVTDVSEYSVPVKNHNQGRNFVKYVFMVRPDGSNEIKEVERWV